MKNLNAFLSFVSIILLTLTGTAQTPNYQWATGGTGTGSESVQKVISDNNGNIIVSGIYSGSMTLDGTTVSTHANNGGSFISSDLFFAKYNATGNLLWVKYPIGVDTCDWTQISDIVADPSGNIYVYMNFVLSSPSSAVVFGNDTIRKIYSLVKFDPNGNVLWHSDSDDNSFNQTKLAVDNSGNVFMATTLGGNTKVFDTVTVTNPHPLGFVESAIVKYNSTGHALWGKTAGGSSWDHVTSINIDNSGNLVVFGQFNSDTMFFEGSTTYLVNTAPSGFGPFDYFYAKYDNNGNLIWAKKIAYASAGLTGNNAAFETAINNAGELFLAGRQTTSNFSIGSVTLNSPGYFVAKIGVNGNSLWATDIGDTLINGPSGLQIDGAGNLYVISQFKTDSVMMANTTLFNTAPGTSTNDIFVAIIDSNGGFIGAFREGGDNGDAASLAVNNNGSLYLSGSFKSNNLTFGSTTLANPNFPNNHMFLTYSTPFIALGQNELDFSREISIYPNPATTEINLKVKNSSVAPISVSILNLMGQAVFSTDFSNIANGKIDISSLNPGMYVLQIQNETGISSGKFIKH